MSHKKQPTPVVAVTVQIMIQVEKKWVEVEENFPCNKQKNHIFLSIILKYCTNQINSTKHTLSGEMLVTS